MNEAQNFTEGPWQLNGSHVYGPDPERRLICQMHYHGTIEDEGNTALVLSAPELRAQRNELLAALKDLFKLIDAGVLVRDISKDHETGFALHQLPLLLTLKSGQAAIARAEGASDAK